MNASPHRLSGCPTTGVGPGQLQDGQTRATRPRFGVTKRSIPAPRYQSTRRNGQSSLASRVRVAISIERVSHHRMVSGQLQGGQTSALWLHNARVEPPICAYSVAICAWIMSPLLRNGLYSSPNVCTSGFGCPYHFQASMCVLGRALDSH